MRKEAILEIIIRARDAASGPIKDIAGNLGMLGGPLAGVQKVAGMAFGALAAGAGLAAGALVTTFDAAAQFEDQMAGINAVLGLSEEQYGLLADEVMRLGRETIFSAHQAGEAIEAMARSGATFEEIMAGAGDAALALAAATKTSMADAGQTTLAVMRMFHLEGDELTSVINSIAGAVNNSQTTLVDFRYAMQATGGIANAMGVSIHDTTAALLMFAQTGLVGERAGTGLKIMLTSLVPKSKPAAEAFERLGFTVNGVNQFFDQSTGKLKPLGDVFQLLQDKIGGLDSQERVAAFRDMFGSRAATMQMVFEAVEQGKAGYEEFQRVLADTSAADIAEARMNSWIGVHEKLSGELETMKIVVGQAFLPLGTMAVSTLEKLASAAQPAVKAFAEWLETGLSKLPGALQELTGINLDNVIAAFSHFENADFGEGLRRFLLDVLGQENMKRIDEFGQFIQDMWTKITSPEAKEFLSETGKNLGEFIGIIVERGPGLIESGGKLIEFISDLLALLPKGGGGEKKGMFEDQLEGLKVFLAFVDEIPAATEGFQQFFAVLTTPFDMTFWKGLDNQFRGWLGGIGTQLKEWADGAGQKAQEFVDGLVDGLSDLGSRISDAVGGAVGGAAETGGNILSSILGTAKDAQQTASEVAGGLFEGLKTELDSMFGGGEPPNWEELLGGSSIGGAVAGVMENLQPLADEIEGIWEDIPVKLQELGTTLSEVDMGGMLSGAITGAQTAVSEAFTTVFGPVPPQVQADLLLIKNHITTEGAAWVAELGLKTSEMATDLATKGQEWLDSTSTKLGEISTQVTTKWDEIKLTVATALGYILDQIQTWWDRGLKETTFKLQAMLRDIQSKFDDIKSSIATKLGEVVASVKAKFEEVRDTAERLIGEAKTKVMNIVGPWVEDMRKKWEEVVADAKRLWEDLKTKVETAIENAKTAAVKKAGEIVTAVTGAWGEMLRKAGEEWGKLKGKLEEGVRSALGIFEKGGQLVQDAVSAIAGLAAEMGQELHAAFDRKIQSLRDSFWGSIQALLNYIKGLLGLGGPGTSTGAGALGKGIGTAMAMGMGEAFANGVKGQQSIMGGAIADATEYLQTLTEEQFNLIRDPWTDFDLDKMRGLRKAGMDMNRTGRGGFVAASRRNYFDVWSRRHGLKPNDPIFPRPPTGYGELPPLPPPPPGGKPAIPKPPPITVNVTMEVAGAVIGRWTKAMLPYIAKDADKWMYTG